MIEVFTIILAATSVASNLIAVGVVLYVRGQIAPLMVKLELHSNEIGSMKATHREDITSLWKEIGDMRERIAKAETKVENYTH